MIGVVTFNLEYGAERYGPDRAANLIAKSGARIALLQEIFQPTPDLFDAAEEIAKILGWYCVVFGKSATAIISQSPIKKINEGGHFGLARTNGIYICVIHLSDTPYIPFEATGIKYPTNCNPCFFSHSSKILERRSFKKRRIELEEIADAISKLPERAKIIAGGDFNEPSHLDWTEEEASLGRVPLAISFPSTRMMEMLGFVDTYRAVNSSPGYTWPDRKINYDFRRDRIDYIFTQNLKVVSSKVIPTKLSDHSMVVSTLKIK